MELNLAPRLNIITGDNGLGKSFLLDVAWFVNTGSWPRDINPTISGGLVARPKPGTEGKITRSYKALEEGEKAVTWVGNFVYDLQKWKFPYIGDVKRFPTIYMMADGSAAIWDPLRNFNDLSLFVSETKDRPWAFVFSQEELWRGKEDANRRKLIQGLVSDWANWQKEKGEKFLLLERLLQALSPDQSKPFKVGNLIRIDVNDMQDMPTLIMDYGVEVAIVHAAAGIRRILSLAYVLVWWWEEHRRAATLYNTDPSEELTFLLDEVECHLHPSWQRKIVPALLEAVKELSKDISVQLIATTHSPLVMASLEPHFDARMDKWFDLDLDRDNGSKPEVKLTDRPFRKYGDAESWLHSRAFDLSSTRSIEGESLLREAKKLMDQTAPSSEEVKLMHQRLVDSLDAMDEFLDYWRLFWRRKEGEE
ncbi:MAG: AAA family ATPase [Bacteroidetes bacterium]|nr:AAA family ATPase [Bacteroidota bacterium]MBP6639873.1 AAA family ATPase [Bacteroidia bacterium]MBP6720998.1 AAA family ATPase [Bacteroidia bacterium]MBP8073486.1 AAA family ATPase [Bacteroidia bacterium]